MYFILRADALGSPRGVAGSLLQCCIQKSAFLVCERISACLSRKLFDPQTSQKTSRIPLKDYSKNNSLTSKGESLIWICEESDLRRKPSQDTGGIVVEHSCARRRLVTPRKKDRANGASQDHCHENPTEKKVDLIA